MTWSPSIRRPEAVPQHMERLAEQLGDLAVEIRSSIAGLAGESVGRVVRDVLLRFWGTQPALPHDNDECSWPHEEWEPTTHVKDESHRVPVRPVTSITWLAVVLQTGGWLLQHATGLGWVSISAAAAGMLLCRGSLGPAGGDAINAVAEIASLVALLVSASKQLQRT